MKLNNRVIKSMGQCVELGLSDKRAAALCGVSREAVTSWKAKGKEDLANGNLETLYARLAIEMREAEARMEQGCLERIRGAGMGGRKGKKTKKLYRTEPVTDVDTGEIVRSSSGAMKVRKILAEETQTEDTSLPAWQADAWLLERLLPEKYSKNSTVNVKGDREEENDAIANHVKRLVKKYNKEE